RRHDGPRACDPRHCQPHGRARVDRRSAAALHESMKQREAMLVLAAVVLAVGVSAILLASSLASTQSASSQRPGIFFSPRNSPPARSVIEAQRDLPAPLQPILPVQRGLTDTARDAAGYLLILLGTSAAH